MLRTLRTLLLAGAALALALTLAVAWAYRRAPRPGVAPRHVLLVTVSGLRADHVSAYGYERPTTDWAVDPGQEALGRALAIDDLARDGLLLTNAFTSSPDELSALKALFTGIGPNQGEVITGLEPDHRTLAEQFRDAGFLTAAFVSGATLRTAGGFDQGFEDFTLTLDDLDSLRRAARWLYDLDLGDERPVFLWVHLAGTEPPYAPRALPPLPGPEADALDYARLLVDPEFAASLPARDWSMYFRHPLYDGPGTWEELELADLSADELAHLVNLYDGEVAQLAGTLRSFLLAYRSIGEVDALWEDTLFVLAGLRGAELGERGTFEPGLHATTARVPLLLRHPGSVVGARVLTEPVELIDIAPTLLDCFDIVPRKRIWWLGTEDGDGRSLLPLIDDFEGRRFVSRGAITIAPAGRHAAAIRDGRWTLLWTFHGDSEELELYDRAVDPLEMEDVAARHPERARRMRNDLVWLLAEVRAGR